MSLARVLSRAQSTAPAAAAAAAAASAPMAPPVPVSDVMAKDLAGFRKRTGLTVTQGWNRYNLEPRGTYTLADARNTAVLSGTTEWTANKKATIYYVAKPTMQTAFGSSRWWSIRWDKRHAWANPLMGWVSSADTHQALNMHTKFETADQAIAFCERNGWKYEVARPFSRVPGRVDASYNYNFVPPTVQVRLDTLGPRKARHMFAHDTGRSLSWVNWRRTPFGAEPWLPAKYQTDSAWTGPGWPAPKIKEANQNEVDA